MQPKSLRSYRSGERKIGYRDIKPEEAPYITAE